MIATKFGGPIIYVVTKYYESCQKTFKDASMAEVDPLDPQIVMPDQGNSPTP